MIGFRKQNKPSFPLWSKAHLPKVWCLLAKCEIKVIYLGSTRVGPFVGNVIIWEHRTTQINKSKHRSLLRHSCFFRWTLLRLVPSADTDKSRIWPSIQKLWTAVLFTRVAEPLLLYALYQRPVLLCESYLLESQDFRKFQSQSYAKTRHKNLHQSSLINGSANLTNRSSGIAYLWYLFVTTLVLISTSNMRLYLRWKVIPVECLTLRN